MIGHRGRNHGISEVFKSGVEVRWAGIVTRGSSFIYGRAQDRQQRKNMAGGSPGAVVNHLTRRNFNLDHLELQ